MDVLLVKEVAAKLRCAQSTVYKLFETGELKGFRIGKAGIRIHAASVEDYVKRRENKPPEPPPPAPLLLPPASKRQPGKRRHRRFEDIIMAPVRRTPAKD